MEIAESSLPIFWRPNKIERFLLKKSPKPVLQFNSLKNEADFRCTLLRELELVCAVWSTQQVMLNPVVAHFAFFVCKPRLLVASAASHYSVRA